MTAPKPRRYPPGPKFHGAWMGAGTGQLAALLAVQVVQAFTHHPLDPGLTHVIFAGASMGVAALGAYLMPHQDRPLPAAPSPEARAQIAWATDYIRSHYGEPPDLAGSPSARTVTSGNVQVVPPDVQPPATGTGSGP